MPQTGTLGRENEARGVWNRRYWWEKKFVCQGQLCVEQPGCSQDLCWLCHQLSFGPHPDVPGTSTEVLFWCHSQKRFLLPVEWVLNSAVSKAPPLMRLSWSFYGFSAPFCSFSSLFSLFLLSPSLVVCSSNFQLFLDNSQTLKYPTESFLPSHHWLWCHSSIPVACAVFPGHS